MGTGDGAGILWYSSWFFLVCDFYYSKTSEYAVGMVFYQKTKLILQDDFETVAIKIWILSDGEMFLSMFQILDKSQPKRTDNKTSVYW
jgi:hypothetical protein